MHLVIWPILVGMFLLLGLAVFTIGVFSWPILIVLILALGLIMMLVEILIIPGFGLAGIGAIILLAAGVYLSWIRLSLAWSIGATLISISSIILSIVFFRKSGFSGNMVLKRRVSDSASLAAPSKQAEEESKKKDSVICVGQIGLAVSNLRPAGIANFQGRRLNVLTDGTYIRKNARIKIIRIEGNRIFVEEEN
jgi:membrane-bound serine protease (ClpP class)